MLEFTSEKFDQFERTQKHIERHSNLDDLFQLFPVNVKSKYQELKDFKVDLKNPKQYFEPKIKMLNHGSYGSLPKIIKEIQQEWTTAFDQNPPKFMAEHPDYMAHQIIALSRFLKLDEQDIVLLSNATTATMSILRSLKLTSNDVILVTSFMYHAVARTLDHLASETNCQIDIIAITVPTSCSEIISKFNDYFLTCEKKPRVCLVDHISSNTALLLPIHEICALLRHQNVISIVDGAHAIGSVELDIPAMDPDFYFSNCHKWLFAPIGSAFMYVSKQYQPITNPVLISHGYIHGFQSKFAFQATRDYTPLFCIEAGLLFHSLFPDLINRNQKLCIYTIEFLKKLWRGSTLYNGNEMIASIAVVLIPLASKYPNEAPHHLSFSLHNQLYKLGFETMCVVVNEQVGIRISTQCYTDAVDFIALGKAVYQILFDERCDDLICQEYLLGSRSLEY
jgi:selenocysteine lyase/cysteine desulfurase